MCISAEIIIVIEKLNKTEFYLKHFRDLFSCCALSSEARLDGAFYIVSNM